MKASTSLTIVAVLLSSLLAFGYFNGFASVPDEPPIDHVTVAILAKDKEATLPIYLKGLESQTWPRDKTYLYVRTNNNTDNTVKILRDWLDKEGNTYAGVHFDDSDVPERVQDFKGHEWNALRFKVLGKVRQDSVNWAKDHRSHYFVVDCDNFIAPDTLETLMSVNLPVVAPLLRGADTSLYTNYHAAIDPNGYCGVSPFHASIMNSQVKGLIELPVVHCTYLIRHDVLDKIVYDDGSGRYEYVIFSDNLRKKNIPQYIDNRKLYGRITFANTEEELQKEPWLSEYRN